MTHDEALTERRADLLRYVGQYIDQNGRPPTFREIRDAVAMKSVAVVSHHIGVLEEHGYLARRRKVARGLRLTGRAEEFLGTVSTHLVRVGIWSTIAAGEPIEVSAGDRPDPTNSAAWILVDPARLPRRRDNLYALEVRGHSMIDALVDDGDIVVLQRTIETREVGNGDMVAAWLVLEQETTLKYFQRDGARVRLVPANPHFEPIETPASNVEIWGKVVLVVRQPGRGRIRQGS